MKQTLTPMDSAELLEIVDRSQLVPHDSLMPVLESIRRRNAGVLPDDAADLADQLVGAGLVSRWQANHLLQSKWQGFFLGRYKLIRPLGSGGMGAVYLAEHRVMGHRVAIKILPKQKAADPGLLERFKNEARTAARLDHPNIVRSLDISAEGGQPFIVMDYISGQDVQKLVTAKGPLPIDQAIRICGQAAAALHHAHERGVVHRDIKPSNLLVGDDGVVRVLDMGLAHWTQEESPELTADGTGSVLGTVDYLSPEQAIHSRGVDGRSDLYSLGCTLFFMLTGRPPFVATSLVQRLAMHQTAPPPNLCDERDDCPEELNDLFQRLLAKRPEDRYETSADVVLELKAIKDAGSKIPAKPGRVRRDPSTQGNTPRKPLSGDTRVTKADHTSVPPSRPAVIKAQRPSSAPTHRPATSSPAPVDDLFGSLPLMETAAGPLSYANHPSLSGPNIPLQPLPNPGRPNQGSPTVKKSPRDSRVNLWVGIGFAGFMALATLGFMIYFITSSGKRDTGVSSFIQSREGDGAEGTIIVLSPER